MRNMCLVSYHSQTESIELEILNNNVCLQPLYICTLMMYYGIMLLASYEYYVNSLEYKASRRTCPA